MSKLSLATVLVIALAPVATGCGSDDPPNAGADALCSSFSWNVKASLSANEKRMRALVEKAVGPGASLGQAVSGAETACPDVVSQYVAAVQGDDSGATAAASSDLEDPRVTSQLTARGVDNGAVLRLGAVWDAIGAADAGQPTSYGEAQRLAATGVQSCDSVAAGEESWHDVASAEEADGLSASQARTYASYLRLHFCANVT